MVPIPNNLHSEGRHGVVTIWPRALAFRALAFLWVLPIALLGCIGALAFRLLGWARPVIRDGAIDIVTSGPFALWMSRRHWAAFTLGPCVWYWSGACGASARIRRHEREHVRQYLRWGPLMLLAYPLASWLAHRGGGHFYRDNAFERAARAAAGE